MRNSRCTPSGPGRAVNRGARSAHFLQGAGAGEAQLSQRIRTRRGRSWPRLDGQHLDLAGGRLRVPREATKTDAGERQIPLLPALRERIGEHRAAYAAGLGEPAFTTRTGRRNTPNNLLNRVIVPAREKANELLAAQCRPPIAHLTPHTLRRTFASLLAVCNVPPRRAMYLLGHTDAKLTLSVYQQVLDVGPGSVELIEQLLGTSLDEARDVLCGHTARAGVLVVNA
jgi:hypothetical protein